PNGQKMSQRLEARIGLRLPGRVEILEGVKPGDSIVTAGHGRIARAESVPVRVIDLANPGGARPGGGPGGTAAGAAAVAAPAARPAASGPRPGPSP
ncbi:MAG: Multidrug resistance protein MdtA precursor, partial [Pseudomonadota bacterium]